MVFENEMMTIVLWKLNAFRALCAVNFQNLNILYKQCAKPLQNLILC